MISVLKAALLQRCPACGKGKLFSSLLTVRERCEACHAPLKEHEQGDGPAFFSIFVSGAIVASLAGYIEVMYEPPYWLHAALWLPMIIVLCLYFLRFFKALLIALQCRHIGLK